jgi:hypothetical protein
MKSFIAPLMVGATLATGLVADDALKAEIDALKAQMAELKKAQESINISALSAQLAEVKAHSAGDNIKWDVDFRTAYDILDYKMGGTATEDESNSVWTNKLTLGMAAQPVDNLVFQGKLGFYKTFGQSSISSSMFQDFDWYGSSKPQSDNSIKLKEAYFLYFGDMGDVHYTASFGRRPSLDGFMTNLREDNAYPASPVGHNINMEFDGASFKFDVEKITGISGMYFKICLGRGFSNTTGSYTSNSTGAFNPGYINAEYNPDMDLAGLLVQLYDNGQYKVMANVFQGWNMMGANMEYSVVGYDGMTPIMNGGMNGFVDVGDMQGASLSLQVNGIGNEINDFLDDSIFFVSYAVNKTQPNDTLYGTIYPNGTYVQDSGMLGSKDDEVGYSFYTGVQFPGFFEDDRIGLEYNHGSKYWRSFTYGEDTLAGSKLATRGDAYELYYTLPLVAKNLTAQIRYTYMNYDYTGSDTFFGQTGTPYTEEEAALYGMTFVKSASDIRLSLRYRY